jgi:hypothetical protein
MLPAKALPTLAQETATAPTSAARSPFNTDLDRERFVVIMNPSQGFFGPGWWAR